ncbi:YhgE/Pip domain-containing protein [Clostridium prolinivorans]|uniref:YhgE/Pip domain-containing protein n=1 Tax=Clostridium prolinivorans TaxID=2769420 RepID=UPI000FD92801|nr:YhgE/Pip domain-containing protein [Clostridium prolinivorans]
MSLFRITKSELETLVENKIKIVAIIAVIAIPLLYTLLYLKAYWDPYGDLENYHIAIVNNDKGAVLDGKNKNYGNDIVDNIKNKNNIGFEFVDRNTAEEGLKNDKYFAEIEIPEDFSQNIVNAKDGNIKNPKLNYISNNKKNYIGTKISESIKNEILKEVNSDISKNYGKIAFDTIYELRDGLKYASDGTSKLINGEDKLYKGGKELANGLNTLNSNVPELKNGFINLKNGTDKLNNGLEKLNSKMMILSDSINKLSDGTKNLKYGITSAKEGAEKITANSKALKDGSDNLNSVYEKQIISGYKQLTGALKNGADKLNNGVLQVRDGVNLLIGTTLQSQENMKKSLTCAEGSLNAYLQANPTAMQDPNIQILLKTMQDIKGQAILSEENSKYIKDIQNGMDSLVSGTQNLSSELDLNNNKSAAFIYYDGLNNFKEQGIKNFTIGVNTYVDSTNKLALGINNLDAGSSELSKGMDSLNSSIPIFSDTVSKLYSGSLNLKDGVSVLNLKMPELFSGIDKLAYGSNKLTDGILSLKSGTEKLKNGLEDGVEKVEDNVKATSEDFGDFIGEPVKVSEMTIGSANSYGSGLAPYFIPISLWLGAVFMLLAIKIKIKDYEKLSNAKLTIGRFIPYALIGIVQAVLLGEIILWLGLKPINIPLLFLFLILMALSFDSIVYTLISLFGLAGEAVAIVLLVLQLCSDAGTFPMEVLPSFFKDISMYLPFTYSVSAIREILFSASMNTSLIIKDSIILTIFGMIFMIINMIFIRKGEIINKVIENNLSV